jgi:hypothetical protein
MAFSLNGATSGIGVGFTVGGPVGAAIGGGLGLISDIWTGGLLSQTQNKATKLSYQAAADSIGGQILQTTSDISSYEEYLAALPKQQAIQSQQFESQARDEFSSLLGNLGMTDVAAGASDRSGLSASAVASEALGKVSDYAGGDLALGGPAKGLYEFSKDELATEQSMQTNQTTRQLDVYKQTLPVLEANKAKYEDLANGVDTSFWGSIFG